MKNMKRFLVSLSACLMIALTHASVEDQSIESRVLKKLREDQQYFQSDVDLGVQSMSKSPQELAQQMHLDSEDEMLKDPIKRVALLKSLMAEAKANLASVNEQIQLLTTKEPAAKFAQLKELLEKRDQLEKEAEALGRAGNWKNWENKRTEIYAIKAQIKQLTTPEEAKAEVAAAQKERDEAFKALLEAWESKSK